MAWRYRDRSVSNAGEEAVRRSWRLALGEKSTSSSSTACTFPQPRFTNRQDNTGSDRVRRFSLKPACDLMLLFHVLSTQRHTESHHHGHLRAIVWPSCIG